MQLNPEDFRPKVNGKADFYSWVLYKWLKKYTPRRIHTNVYKIETGELFIGTVSPIGMFAGRRLRELCRAPTNLTLFYIPKFKAVDITEEFWKHYAKCGLCAIHPTIHSWNYVDNKNMRTCSRCGVEEESMTVYAPKLIWISKNTIQEALYAGDWTELDKGTESSN